MAENVNLLYHLIETDMKLKGYNEEEIEDAKNECLEERDRCQAGENTLCLKEKSYLSEQSLWVISSYMSEINKKEENTDSKIKKGKIKYNLKRVFNDKLILAFIYLIYFSINIYFLESGYPIIQSKQYFWPFDIKEFQMEYNDKITTLTMYDSSEFVIYSLIIPLLLFLIVKIISFLKNKSK